MALYSVTNTSAASPTQTNVAAAPGKTMLQVAATTTSGRGYVYEFEIGADGLPNPTDCPIVWHALAQTTSGTGGVAMTANPLDPADVATRMVNLGNFTAEPTGVSTTIKWSLGANQRASYRWVVNPGGPGELVFPQTNLNGIGIRAQSSTYLSTASVCLFYRE